MTPAGVSTAQPDPEPDPIMVRLDDQIAWYSRASTRNRRGHWTARLTSLLMAAAVPITAVIGSSALVPALLGAGIVVVEGAHELFRFHQNWLNFQGTAEALKHEKYLFLADAGPYRRPRNARALLAERVEALVSTETSQWVAIQESQRTAGAEAEAEAPEPGAETR